MNDRRDSWVTGWTAVVPWDRDEESVDWIRSRPDSVKRLMLLFPPGSVVRFRAEPPCPSLGRLAIVTSYFEPSVENPEGGLSVRGDPGSETRHPCDLDQVEVVGYFRGLTPEVMSSIMAEEPGRATVKPGGLRK